MSTLVAFPKRLQESPPLQSGPLSFSFLASRDEGGGLGPMSYDKKKCSSFFFFFALFFLLFFFFFFLLLSFFFCSFFLLFLSFLFSFFFLYLFSFFPFFFYLYFLCFFFLAWTGWCSFSLCALIPLTVSCAGKYIHKRNSLHL